MAKLNPTGSALVYVAQLGGSGSSSPDRGYRIAVDGSDNAYVMGMASSSDFPTTPSGYQRAFAIGTDSAFVTELNAAGTALVYSTFLSGGGGAASFLTSPLGGIAVDNHGNIYVTGVTGSTKFPTKNALQPLTAEAIPTPSWPRSILRRWEPRRSFTRPISAATIRMKAMALPWTARAMRTSRGSRIHWTSQPRTPINRNGLHRLASMQPSDAFVTKISFK